MLSALPNIVGGRCGGDATQAAAEQDLQGLLEVCSRSFSAWFMAHAPPLLASHPAAPATLRRHLPHLGSDQARVSARLIRPPACPVTMLPILAFGNTRHYNLPRKPETSMKL